MKRTRGILIEEGTTTRNTDEKLWRIVIDGTNLLIQQYVDREWKTKSTITGE